MAERLLDVDDDQGGVGHFRPHWNAIVAIIVPDRMRESDEAAKLRTIWANYSTLGRLGAYGDDTPC